MTGHSVTRQAGRQSMPVPLPPDLPCQAMLSLDKPIHTGRHSQPHQPADHSTYRTAPMQATIPAIPTRQSIPSLTGTTTLVRPARAPRHATLPRPVPTGLAMPGRIRPDRPFQATPRDEPIHTPPVGHTVPDPIDNTHRTPPTCRTSPIRIDTPFLPSPTHRATPYRQPTYRSNPVRPTDRTPPHDEPDRTPPISRIQRRT